MLVTGIGSQARSFGSQARISTLSRIAKVVKCSGVMAGGFTAGRGRTARVNFFSGIAGGILLRLLTRHNSRRGKATLKIRIATYTSIVEKPHRWCWRRGGVPHILLGRLKVVGEGMAS